MTSLSQPVAETSARKSGGQIGPGNGTSRSDRPGGVLAGDVLARPRGQGHDGERRADGAGRHVTAGVGYEQVGNVPGLVVLVQDRTGRARRAVPRLALP